MRVPGWYWVRITGYSQRPWDEEVDRMREVFK